MITLIMMDSGLIVGKDREKLGKEKMLGENSDNKGRKCGIMGRNGMFRFKKKKGKVRKKPSGS